MSLQTLTDRTFHYFHELCQIPRCSGNEAGVADYLCRWAESNSYVVIKDEIGNVIIQVPGKGSPANQQPVIIQGHMDMVCVKESDSTHNFCTDPIQTVIEDGWMKAKGTTLGADNGIAIAIAQALSEAQDIDCPPMELLFTVDEERGLTGANFLKPGILQGKYMINIDSEEEGEITIGCAGGRDTHIDYDFKRQPNTFDTAYTISIKGLIGGHSGMEINQPRANAIQLLGRMLNDLGKSLMFSLVEINGGVAHNAIPREASCIIAVHSNDISTLQNRFLEFKNILFNEVLHNEPDFSLDITLCESKAEEVITAEDTLKIISLILAMPHGVTYFDDKNPVLVETSNNFARIMIKQSTLQIQTSQRSSSASRIDFITSKVESVAKICGARAKSGNGYPSWQPLWESGLLTKSKEAYYELFQKEIGVKVIHAGLECGIIGSKYPDMEMISIGPNIRTPHSPQERMEVASVEKVIAFIMALFKKL